MFSRRRILPLLTILALTLTLLLIHPAAQSASAPPGAGSPAKPSPEKLVSSAQRIDPDCQRFGRCLVNARMVFASLDVERVTSNLDQPNQYTISGWFSLNWLPAAYPDWQPSSLSLGCRSSACRFSGWRDSFSETIRGRRFWTARFELETRESDSFFAYPFDQHWVKIQILPTNTSRVQLVDYIDIDGFNIELAPSLTEGRNSNFRIDYATVGQQTNFYLRNINILDPKSTTQPPTSSNSEASQPSITPSDSSNRPVESDQIFPESEDENISTSVSLHLVRRTPAALLMIITPMVLILFNTILAFHWRENSPASRFGSSGLLTTVSLFFASRVFRPDVDHLVFSDLWFLVVFAIITINNVALAWLFRFYKYRADIKRTNASIPPAWTTENRLTLISGSAVMGIIAILFVTSLIMLRPPSIPIDFLAGNSNFDDIGASVVKVIEQNELLPSRYLIDMPPPGSPSRTQ